MLNIKMTKQLGEMALNVDIQLPSTGISAIFGRSGAGKTTLINALSGLSRPDTGCIQLGECVLFDHLKRINLPPEKRRIGYVFQDARLFPHYKVLGNLKYGMRSFDPVYFDDVVDLLGIRLLLNRYPNALSGGEKQRVAIGRALLSHPNMLLMDEPLAALDLPRKKELIAYLDRLAQEIKIPIVYVTHSLDEILRLADHMVMLHQGKVVVSGSIADVWGSSEMRPWIPIEAQSALLTVKMGQQHPQYPLTQVWLDSQVSLWVNGVFSDIGQYLRIRIYANDVSLTRQRSEQTSIRNIIQVMVVGLDCSETKEIVTVTLQVGKVVLWANITPWAVDDLLLKVGDVLFAQIKGVSVTQNTLG